jgi:hypothetical protein
MNTLARRPAIPNQPGKRIADFSKVLVIEKPIELVLASPTSAPTIGTASETSGPEKSMQSNLAQDTSFNEVYRRFQIHEHLAQANWISPRSLTKWLYREVLNTDLDDPYLGMKDLLFANYPFADDVQ